MSSTSSASRPQIRADWQAALAALPATPDRIPSFFFAHGSPMLTMTPSSTPSTSPVADIVRHIGSEGPLAHFLTDFGPVLLEKYKPKAILVFSAHFATKDKYLVTDYGEENPLLYDYYGFDRDMYTLKFSSRGDGALSKRIVQAFTDAGLGARTTPVTESRGRDGRGFAGPGFDHGVFIPFRLMFGTSLRSIPIIEASFDDSLNAEANWRIGLAVERLRNEGVLVLAGGLTVHNLQDINTFAPDKAPAELKAFSEAVTDAIAIPDPEKRKETMFALQRHPGFKLAHPHADHFIPLYVAGGAGAEGGTHVLSAFYGCHTVAFGV